MAFFDEIGKKITDVSQQTVKKTKEMAEILKYNSMISDEEKNIRDHYLKLGEMYYKDHADQTDGDYSELMTKINESNSRILDYKKAIEDINTEPKCPKCGASVSADDTFCIVCGANLQEVSHDEINNSLICENCGKELTPEAEFCSFCGTKVQKG